MRPLLTVIVPVYNGGDEIVENVEVIRAAVTSELADDEVELIVVSDGSIDGTAERLLERRSDHRIRVLHYDRNLGKGYAVKAGALAAHGSWVALVDADLDLDPRSVPRYLDVARRESLDFVIGSKRHPESVVVYPRSRRIASWCYQQLNRLLFRLDVSDTQVGLKVFSRGVVDTVFPLLLVKRFAFDLELLAVGTALGCGRIRELPVRLEYQFSGSELRSRAVGRALWDTAAIFYRLRILRTYQRKRGLVRGASALLPESQPLVSLVGDGTVAATLDYARIELAGDVESARGELLALVGRRARPAGNWITAAVAYFRDADVAAVVVPAVTPPQASFRERVAAAVLESRFGGGSRRSRYFPGNVRLVADLPTDTIIIRRDDFDAAVDRERLVAWLAERGRKTVYTPDTSVSVPPPPVVRPHFAATFAHARSRGAAGRATRGTSSSAETALTLAPAAIAASGAALIALGSQSVRDVGYGLVGAYAVSIGVSATLAALRFRSAGVGLAAAPVFVGTHATYIAGFVRGFVGRP